MNRKGNIRKDGRMKPLKLRVNGEPVHLLLEEDETLLDVLRDRLFLTGTKRGCGEGQCGHCTVLLDGKAINSCLTLALEAEGGEVLTVEGLAQGDSLHPIQKAYVETGAVQCGYCTPGMIMAIYSLLRENPRPGEDEIREGIKGVMCRCTGYYKIVEAVKVASAEVRRRG
jgi:carbon-monoxide dehydrogenase small subunit